MLILIPIKKGFPREKSISSVLVLEQLLLIETVIETATILFLFLFFLFFSQHLE